MSKKQVLFLCTGNSCRSQMAEGLVNHFLGEQWQAHSAGTKPTGYVHPLAVKSMVELGIDVSDYRSKSLDEFRNTEFNLVVTVCDSAAEDCPVWLGVGRTVHLGFPDPAKAGGTEIERLAVFQGVRDDMAKTVLSYLKNEARN